MNDNNWRRLESTLEMRGFSLQSSWGVGPTTRWFASADEPVSTYLRFVFKPKMSVLTAHIGWRHEPSHAFCLAALKTDWPRGFTWLETSGVANSPCLSLFNLADYMGWSLGGMPIGDHASVYEGAGFRLGEAIDKGGWTHTTSDSLLTRYVFDQAPFGWKCTNSAIRIAQIAGICSSLGAHRGLFEKCAAEHVSLIEADMFSLGSAENWIDSLRFKMG